MRRYSFLLLLALLLPRVSSAQTFTSFDTVFTPANYPDGALTGTMFLPIAPDGISIVVMHGLGDPVWTMDGWCDSLAAEGYTVLNIDYPDPVNSGATFPMPVRALKAAVQFLRRSRDHFHLSTIMVGAIGRSLGAGIIAQSLIDEGDYSAYGIDSTITDHIDFAALLYGIYDFNHFTQSSLPISIPTFALYNYFGGDTALEARETPVLQAGRITAPILLIHGEQDTVLQYQQSVEFHDSLAANGKLNDLILYPDGNHSLEAANQGLAFSSVGLEIKDSVLAYFANQSAHAGVSDEFSTNEIAPNVPNPCGKSSPSGSPKTALTVHFAQAGNCSIILFNSSGAVIRSSTPEFLSAGNHSITLDIHGLPSGTYFCRISDADEYFMRSITVEN